jgi:hypothetical protein
MPKDESRTRHVFKSHSVNSFNLPFTWLQVFGEVSNQPFKMALESNSPSYISSQPVYKVFGAVQYHPPGSLNLPLLRFQVFGEIRAGSKGQPRRLQCHTRRPGCPPRGSQLRERRAEDRRSGRSCGGGCSPIRHQADSEPVQLAGKAGAQEGQGGEGAGEGSSEFFGSLLRFLMAR